MPERDRCKLNTYIYNEMSKSDEGIINNSVKHIPYLIILCRFYAEVCRNNVFIAYVFVVVVKYK